MSHFRNPTSNILRDRYSTGKKKLYNIKLFSCKLCKYTWNCRQQSVQPQEGFLNLLVPPTKNISFQRRLTASACVLAFPLPDLNSAEGLRLMSLVVDINVRRLFLRHRKAWSCISRHTLASFGCDCHSRHLANFHCCDLQISKKGSDQKNFSSDMIKGNRVAGLSSLQRNSLRPFRGRRAKLAGSPRCPRSAADLESLQRRSPSAQGHPHGQYPPPEVSPFFCEVCCIEADIQHREEPRSCATAFELCRLKWFQIFQLIFLVLKLVLHLHQALQVLSLWFHCPSLM